MSDHTFPDDGPARYYDWKREEARIARNKLEAARDAFKTNPTEKNLIALNKAEERYEEAYNVGD